MEAVVEKYSRALFRLPSATRLFSYVLAASLASGLGFSLPLLEGAGPIAYLVSSALFPLAVLFSWLLDAVIMREDPILNMRRCLGLELFSLSALGPLSAMGGLLSALLGRWPSVALRLVSVGAALSISARALTTASASLAGPGRSIACTATSPALWLVASAGSTMLAGLAPSPSDLAFMALALAAGSLATGAFLALIRRIGLRLFGVSSFRLIRAFTASWTEDYNEPLEAFLDEIGEEADVRSRVLLFEDAETGEALGLLVVPGVHPGPFRWVGSSPLPSLIQEAVEREMGCPVAVPHGISGHELNLTSRGQCEKLISRVLSALRRPEGLRGPHEGATGFSRAEAGSARASCQLFGPLALLTLTAAPETMEDLPPELDELLRAEAVSLGLEEAIAIDAHNCIDGSFDRLGAVERFRRAASEAMRGALEAPRGPFRVGFGRAIPEGFSIDDGMGPGGIVAMAVEVGGSKWAYVVIDGNNMVRGLRERLLAEAEALGFSGGEVMTTDTHVVNARVLVERGYHPVGEVMDWDVLASYVREALQKALRAMRPARLRWGIVEARGLRVFGAEQLKRLCELPLDSIRAVRNTAVCLLGPVHALLLLLAFLL